MESLILEAYRKAGDNKFFTITKTLERLLLERYGTTSKLVACTTKEVLAILEHNRLDFVL